MVGYYGLHNDFHNYDGVTAGVLTAHAQCARWDLYLTLVGGTVSCNFELVWSCCMGCIP